MPDAVQQPGAPARSARPDVVLMNVRMPGMDGLEATRRNRAQLVMYAYETGLAVPGATS